MFGWQPSSPSFAFGSQHCVAAFPQFMGEVSSSFKRTNSTCSLQALVTEQERATCSPLPLTLELKSTPKQACAQQDKDGDACASKEVAAHNQPRGPDVTPADAMPQV